MRIIDLLDKKSIQLNAVASGKKDVLDQAGYADGTKW